MGTSQSQRSGECPQHQDSSEASAGLRGDLNAPGSMTSSMCRFRGEPNPENVENGRPLASSRQWTKTKCIRGLSGYSNT